MKEDNAETVAIQALTWLAGQDELFPVFLGASGANVNDLKHSASDPAFLGAVLDFILMEDASVRAFCDTCGLGYDQPMRARQYLPGGEMMNWT